MKIGFSPLQRRQQNGVTLRPPIKGRIPQVNDSTPLRYISGLSSRDRSLSIPLIKSVATVTMVASQPSAEAHT